MPNKAFLVTEVNKGQGSVRIMLNSEMNIKPGNRYYQRLRADGVIELIPENMEIPKKIPKSEFLSAIVSRYEQINQLMQQVNEEIDKITTIVKELKQY